MTWIRSDFIDGRGAEILMRKKWQAVPWLCGGLLGKLETWLGAMASSDFYRSLACVVRVKGVLMSLYES